jgi:hypothetical protein
MDTSPLSQLPEFEVTVFHIQEPRGSWDMLQVRCPRSHCHAEFWVQRKWGIIRPVTGREDDPPALPVGRNCPHCSRVSAIPKPYRIKWGPHRTTQPKRRVVRRRRSKS